VSSNCSTDEELTSATAVATQLARALDAIARESTVTYGLMLRRLDWVRVRIRVDDELFDVASDAARGVLRVEPVDGEARVVIETSRAVVRDVLAGRSTLPEVLRSGALTARGTLRDLVAVLSALEAFVHGAVRSRATAELFHDFQTEGAA
jgi:hypothetical protein